MNKKYIAIVRKNGNIQNIADGDYKTKQAFARDLRANEYKVLKVFTEKEIEEIKNTDWSILLNKKGYNKMLDNCFEYIKACL